MVLVDIVGLLIGAAALVWMVRAWLDRRFKKLNRKLKKHDKADRALRREIREARADTKALREDMEKGFENWTDAIVEGVSKFLEDRAA